MTFYVLDSIRDLEKRFSVLASIVLQRYAECHALPSDVDKSLDHLPHHLRQRYGHLVRDNQQLLGEAASVKEFVIKISSGIDFMNSCELIEYMMGRFGSSTEQELVGAFMKDLRRTLSYISVCDVAGMWVSSVPRGSVELTLHLDDHWQYKSLEDLRTFHLHYPHRYWHFKQVVSMDGAMALVYAVPRCTRLYQIEQHSLKSSDIVGVQVGSEKILDFTAVSILVALVGRCGIDRFGEIQLIDCID